MLTYWGFGFSKRAKGCAGALWVWWFCHHGLGIALIYCPPDGDGNDFHEYGKYKINFEDAAINSADAPTADPTKDPTEETRKDPFGDQSPLIEAEAHELLLQKRVSSGKAEMVICDNQRNDCDPTQD